MCCVLEGEKEGGEVEVKCVRRYVCVCVWRGGGEEEGGE